MTVCTLTQLKTVGAPGPISRSCQGCAATDLRDMDERILSLRGGCGAWWALVPFCTFSVMLGGAICWTPMNGNKMHSCSSSSTWHAFILDEEDPEWIKQVRSKQYTQEVSQILQLVPTKINKKRKWKSHHPATGRMNLAAKTASPSTLRKEINQPNATQCVFDFAKNVRQIDADRIDHRHTQARLRRSELTQS